ncbi:MAG: BCD family MFS transporter [Pseudomonadota bacterium]
MTTATANTGAMEQPFSWFSIIRLGLVQTSLGAIVVLMTTTLNRIMVVELQLLALVPGALVAFHYAVQLSRPRWGYGADVGGRRTPFIIGGMAVLAAGGILAAVATWLMATSFAGGLLLAIFAFLLVGVGVGAAGTNLLALLATKVSERRRPAAASIVWIMMIAGFAVTAATVGQILDPFSFERLITITAAVCLLAVAVTAIAIFGLEKPRNSSPAGAMRTDLGEGAPHGIASTAAFVAAFREVWAEDKARQFTIFVFVSMLAYSAQDLILEPFAGIVFGMTPGQSTSLGGAQHAGVLVGMILVALAGSAYGRGRFGSMRFWAVGGCLASALAFVGLTIGSYLPEVWPLEANVMALGMANGAFAVAAIGSMMGLANSGRAKREGTRMGLWGAAQAIGFGIGVFAGTAAVDLMRVVFEAPNDAYAAVFFAEALLFVVSAAIAWRVSPAAVADKRIEMASSKTMHSPVLSGHKEAFRP